MIKQIATSIMIFMIYYSYGQSSTRAEIDSLYEQGFQLRNGPLDSAFSFISESGRMSETAGYETGALKAEIFSMFFLARKGQLDSAAVIEENVMKSLLNSELRGTFQEALAYYYAGIVKLRGQELPQAKVYYSKALPIFQKLKDDYFIGSTYSRLGIIEMELSNYSEALELFVRSYELKVAASRPPGEYAPELANISQVYWRMGFVEDAFDYARRSLKLEKDRGNHLNIARSLMNIGALHTPNNRDSALYYYDASYQIASRNGFIKTAALAKYNRSLILRNSGKHDESIKEMEEMLKEVKVHNYSDMNTAIYALLAENHFRKGEVNETITYAQISLRLSLQAANKRSIYRAARILGMAHERQLNSDSVLFYTKMYYSYRDSVFSRENQAKITTLNSRLDNLEIQKEIAILEKQKQLDEVSRIQLITLLGALTIISALVVALLIYRHKNNQKKQALRELEVENKIKDKEQELQQQTLHMINLNHGVSELENQLLEIKEKPVISARDVQKMLGNIKMNKSIEKEWQNFDTYFGKMHRGFYENLGEKHPDLSVQNKRLAALIKIDLSNKEIGQILNISHGSVKMGRYRLKSKLNLSEDDKLASYLKSI